jgi:hypothetical protein
MTIGTFTLFAVTGSLVAMKLVLMALAAVLLTNILFSGKKGFGLSALSARLPTRDMRR